MNDFAVFILTHGRPNNVKTLHTLERCGYRGMVYLVVDDEDETLPDYQAQYGDQVIVFSKEAIAGTFDKGGGVTNRNVVVYARNACFQIARDLGYTYFMELDDDYGAFDYRFDDKLGYKQTVIHDLDAILSSLLAYFKATPITSLCIGQSGDYFGGQHSTIAKSVRTSRKAMNTFICSTERPFQFIGNINEDVNTYTAVGNRGALFLTIFQVSITQSLTQQQDGGMADIYLDDGTYVKSFYTVMFAPGYTSIRLMGYLYPRLHHSIKWNHAVPKIVSERHKKPQPIEES